MLVQVHGIMIRYFYALQNDHFDMFSYPITAPQRYHNKIDYMPQAVHLITCDSFIL